MSVKFTTVAIAITTLICLSSTLFGTSDSTNPSPSATLGPLETREILNSWTKFLDYMYAHGKSMRDMDAFFQRLSKNQYFDIGEQSKLHPRYINELRRIADLRGQSLPTSNSDAQAIARLLEYVIAATVLGLIIKEWTKRVARQTSLVPSMSRSSCYGKLLLTMSWRVGIIIIAVFVVAAMFIPWSVYTPEEASESLSYAAGPLIPVCAVLFLWTAWTQTKRKFKEPAPPGDDANRSSSVRELRDFRPLTWWKRLFTVIEIAVGLMAVGLWTLLYFTGPDYSKPSVLTLLWFIVIPVTIVRLLRIAVTYVVEGGAHRR